MNIYIRGKSADVCVDRRVAVNTVRCRSALSAVSPTADEHAIRYDTIDDLHWKN